MNEALVFSHPLDRLKIDIPDPLKWKWDCLNEPEILLAEGSAEISYMPFFLVIEADYMGRRKCPEDGKWKYHFALTHRVPLIWQEFFKKHHKGANVSFDGDRLILCCRPKNFPKIMQEICNHTVHAATRDYVAERRALLSQVFRRSYEQEWRRRTETEILTEFDVFKQKQEECAHSAQANGSSVFGSIQNFNFHYRQILEVKFGWWRHILDDQAIRRFRALFESKLQPELSGV